ncbi:MAG TPA: branched-chain amino acid ABC transporter substrate-binding protein [Alphaproteobacteria bacterium]
MRKSGLVLFAAALALAAPAAMAQDIVIATIGPMTGSNASFGEQMRRGAEMAVKDINAKGGVLGRKLRLEIGDDACDPKQAVAVANQLASRGVVFVAGHYCSGSSIPASEVYADEGILQISPASTNPLLTERGTKFKNVFRVCGRDDQQGVVGADYLIDHFKGKNLAVVDDKSQYGKGLADFARKRFAEKGVKIALNESVNDKDTDFSALISKMKQAGVEVIYFGGYHTQAGLITRQARDQGLKVTLAAGDALTSQEFWSIAGPAGEGTLMTFDADPRKNPVAAPIVAEFRKGGYDPEGYTLYTYAAIQIYVEAVKQAKSTKLADILGPMHSVRFETVLGPIAFDGKGDVTTPAYKVYAWKGGKYDYAN